MSIHLFHSFINIYIYIYIYPGWDERTPPTDNNNNNTDTSQDT